MKIIYGGVKREKNFLRGLQKQMRVKDSSLIHSYKSFPSSLSNVSAVVLSGDLKPFFQSRNKLSSFVYDARRDNTCLFFLGRYYDKPVEIINKEFTRIRASNRTLERIGKDIFSLI
ncbi:MAG: hypothetical protein ACOCUU_01725 [Nanoarchaeota archaeon]